MSDFIELSEQGYIILMPGFVMIHRFKGPVPAHSWNGTFVATSDTTPCPQLSGNAVIGDEDCLYVNVYTPQVCRDV